MQILTCWTRRGFRPASGTVEQLSMHAWRLTNHTILETVYFQDGDVHMNSYFGAVLCSEDVNADGYDDLLVGAPMWSKPPPEFDNGAIYLYLGTAQQVQCNARIEQTFQCKIETKAIKFW